MTYKTRQLLSLLLTTLLGFAMAGQPAYGQDSDAQRFIQLTTQMEEHPAPMDDGDRKWMVQVMQDRDDIHVVLNLDLVSKLFGLEVPTGPGNKMEESQEQNPLLLPGRPELFLQFIYGQAAYELAHPDRTNHGLETQIAGIRSMLALYPRLREQNPDVQIERLDELLAEGSNGQLEGELRRLAIPYVSVSREDISDRFWGEWAVDPERCGDGGSNSSLKIWKRGVRYSANLEIEFRWWQMGDRGLVIARYEKMEDRWGYNTVEYLEISEDQTYLALESERDVPDLYYRCAPEETEKPTSLAEARELVKESMTAKGAEEFHERLHRDRWLSSRVGAMHRLCGRAGLEGDDQSFALYFRLADTGRVKESLLEGKTPYSSCVYSRMTEMVSIFPAPLEDDFWLKIDMDMTLPDE